MPSNDLRDADWAFAAYESVRDRLPVAEFPRISKYVENLADLAGHADIFLLDAFGVLNVGESAIPGSPARIQDLQQAGKTVMVVSNAASYPKRALLKKYSILGFEFTPQNVLTSREAMLANLSQRAPGFYGMMAARSLGLEELDHLTAVFLEENHQDYDAVSEFLLIGTSEWTEQRQLMLETSLRANPRPVLVGNPDIVAPREYGLSIEPGHYAHRLMDITGISPEFFGKPFANIFEMAVSRLPTNTNPNRVVMVGDTLHTDILGGRAAGFKTALITDYGSLKGMDVSQAIKQSGIVPDFIMPRP